MSVATTIRLSPQTTRPTDPPVGAILSALVTIAPSTEVPPIPTTIGEIEARIVVNPADPVYQSHSDLLDSISIWTEPGIMVRTGQYTAAVRSIVSGDSSITITNPDGVGGDIDIRAAGGGSGVNPAVPLTWTGLQSFSQASGQPPIAIVTAYAAGATVANLSADLLDGNHASAFALSGHTHSEYITAETDPVFGASAAAGITSTQITDWDTAFGWGDHAGAGYLTAETDPVFAASDAAGITSTDITNWGTAYGWGDHAGAGYLTAETDPVFAASDAAGITGTQIANWDDAYGWGDHASLYAAADHDHDLVYAPLSHGHDATDVAVDSVGFVGNLSTADDTVQQALATLDALDVGGGGTTPEPGTITRDSDGYIVSVATTSKTTTFTRSAGRIATANDGTTLWTFILDGDDNLVSWTVEVSP